MCLVYAMLYVSRYACAYVLYSLFCSSADMRGLNRRIFVALRWPRAARGAPRPQRQVAGLPRRSFGRHRRQRVLDARAVRLPRHVAAAAD